MIAVFSGLASIEIVSGILAGVNVEVGVILTDGVGVAELSVSTGAHAPNNAATTIAVKITIAWVTRLGMIEFHHQVLQG